MKTPILSLLLLLLLTPLLLPAQRPQAQLPEIPRFSLSITAIGFDTAPELYWLDLEYDMYGQEIREFKPVSVGLGARGETVEIPIKPPLHLYRQQPGEPAPQYTPVLTLSTREKDDKILAVFHRKPDGASGIHYVDDSAAAHPAQTVRVLNLSDINMAATIGGDTILVRPNALQSLGKPVFTEGTRFHFTFGVTLPDQGAWQAPTRNLRFRREDQRLLIIYTLLPAFEEVTTPNGAVRSQRVLRPEAFRMYDRVLSPEAPPHTP